MANIPILQSSTMEGAFLELALFLQIYEKFRYINKGEHNFINITIDTDQKRAVIAATIPINFATTGNGGYIVAVPYLETISDPNSMPGLLTWEEYHATAG